jgi:hypothetical protein
MCYPNRFWRYNRRALDQPAREGRAWQKSKGRRALLYLLSSGWYSNWVWCPADDGNETGVYGCYSAGSPRILSTYYNGTDVCTQRGVICNDDMATLLVTPKNGVYAGQVVGFYGYGWNGPSYVKSSALGNATVVQLTQLGYPQAFDSGLQMQRNDAVGWYYTSGSLKNTVMGSAMTGGASGGPWLINFGTFPSITAGQASLGSYTSMWVVGVTGYGSLTIGYNQIGASYFGQNSQYNNATNVGNAGINYGAGNIGALVAATCAASPAYC